MILLDTHVALWMLGAPSRLGPQARALLEGADDVRLSAASVWEIEIAVSTGKLEVPHDLVAQARRAGLQDLPVTLAHAEATRSVVTPHRDPFDRMLLAQARHEDATFVTADSAILRLDDQRCVDART